jgi:hypothetical protein
MVSHRLRLRTYVLDAGFWNAVLLARDVATLDALSDGRVELGVGAGHIRHEHENARLPWLPFRDRVAAMARPAGRGVRRRQIYGFDRFSAHEANFEPLGQVIAVLPGTPDGRTTQTPLP